MLIYDCEILRAIPGGASVDGIEYCNGWGDFPGMGIACIGFETEQGCAICVGIDLGKLDFDPFDYGVPIYSGWGEFRKAVQNANYICGFNSISFDDNLIQGNFILSDSGFRTDYDLLQEVRLAAYGSISHLDMIDGHSYALGKIAIANGENKTLSGSLAPIYWQQGRYKEVIDYCLSDVRITSRMLSLGLAGKLIDPNTGALLQLRSIDEALS